MLPGGGGEKGSGLSGAGMGFTPVRHSFHELSLLNHFVIEFIGKVQHLVMFGGL